MFCIFENKFLIPKIKKILNIRKEVEKFESWNFIIL